MMRTVRKHLKRSAEFWWGDRGFSAFLFLLLVLMFLAPFVRLSVARALLSVFFTFLLISGVATMTDRKFHRAVAWVVAGNSFVFNILHQIVPGRAITGLWYVSAVAFLSLLIGVLIKQVFRAGAVTGHRIRGAIAAYLLIGITWTYIYALIALFSKDAFSFPPSVTAQPGESEHQAALVYFSFITMATLGYGDIVPVHPMARMFAMGEALIGLLYPATLLARLVSLEIIYRNESGDRREHDKSGRREDK